MTSPPYTALEIQTENEQPFPAPIVETGRPWRQFVYEMCQVAGYTCLGTAFFAFLFIPHYLWYRYILHISCEAID